MIILLVQPCQFNRFYKNPYRLQAICWQAAALIPQYDFQIWDRDTSEIPPESCFVMILDAAEASFEDLCYCIDTVQAEHILLLDDLYGYDIQLKHCYIQHDFYTVQLSDVFEYLNKPAGTADIDKNCHVERKLYMSDSIREEFLRRGVQYFSEGVARGCEGNCNFCKLSCRQGRNSVQFVSYCAPELIAQAEAILPSPLFVQFSDENFFGFSQERLAQVYQLALQLCKQGFNGILGVDTRLDSIPCGKPITGSLEDLRLSCWNMMLHAGLRYCFVGIESFCPSQSERYGKSYESFYLKNALSFFENNRLIFTFGLILWDPHMTQEELCANIKFIREFELLGKTASLIKPLRIIPGSNYEKLYCKDLLPLPVPSGGTEEWDTIAALYRDSKIRLMARLLFPIYGAFDGAGYRHSDVSMFEAKFTLNTPGILYQIPKIIAQMEMSLIDKLLIYSKAELEKMSTGDLVPICVETVQKLQNQLQSFTQCISEHQSVIRYYIQTFGDVLANLYLLQKNN